ncbi:hypothetical protein EGW08_014725 [Elysia chlorotica]|uniref:Cytokine-inducible SH2-containing protein n=1 Tax=Elysia chlorotica TaxID=188477 RepID=A0A433T7I3_ELYCH|nr:hypothetical protein EGW08_014725 [Elysia chlorotica]
MTLLNRECVEEDQPTIELFSTTSKSTILPQHLQLFSNLTCGRTHCARITSQLENFPVLHQTPVVQIQLSSQLVRKLLLVNERRQSIMCHNSKQTSVLGGELDLPSQSWERNFLAVVGQHTEDDDDEDRPRQDSGFSSGGISLSLGYYKPLQRCMDDFEKLNVVMDELDESHFYWGDMDSDTARRRLRSAPVGTFLVRASSDSRFLYSLSVKTERGATSVRILYEGGLFQFDCDSSIRDQLPRFESVLALVDFYVLLSQEGGNRLWRWEEVSGDKHMKMTLLQPLRSSVPSLAHQARVKVNQCLENVFFPNLSVDKLNIPDKMKAFLRAYPYRS